MKRISVLSFFQLFILLVVIPGSTLAQTKPPTPPRPTPTPPPRAATTVTTDRTDPFARYNQKFRFGGMINLIPTGEQPEKIEVALRAKGAYFDQAVSTFTGREFFFSEVPFAMDYQLSVALSGCATCEKVSLSLDPGTIERGYINFRLLRDPSAPADKQIRLEALLLPDKARRELEKARESEDKGKMEDALKSIDKAMGQASEFPEPYMEKARLLLKMNQRAAAEPLLQKAVSIDPANFIGHKLLGYLYLTTGKETDAIPEIDAALKLSPEDVDCLAFRGEALYQTKQYEDAAASLSKALELAPDYYRASWRLGYAYVQLKKYPEALKAFEQFMKTNKKLPTAKVEELMQQLRAATGTQG